MTIKESVAAVATALALVASLVGCAASPAPRAGSPFAPQPAGQPVLHCASYEWLPPTPATQALSPGHKVGAQLIITGGSAAPSGSAGGDLSGTYPNPSVGAISGSSPILITPNTLEWTKGTTAPTLTVATPTSDVATVPLLIQSQAPWASAATNVTPGNIVFNTPAPISGTNYGYVLFQSGGVTAAAIGKTSGAGSYSAIYLNGTGVVPSPSNYILRGDTTDGNVDLNSPGSNTVLTLRVNTNVELSIVPSTITMTPPALSWVNSAVAPNVSQVALTSTSAGSGAAGQPMSVTAQAGESATGSAHNGGAGGNLALSAGAGGTSGSATAGIGGVLALGSGQTVKVTNISATTYTVDTNSTTSDFLIFTDSTSNAITITLPVPTAGRYLMIKDKTGKSATHNVTVSQHSAETIDGASTVVFTKNYDSLALVSDGTNWSVVSEFSSSIVP